MMTSQRLRYSCCISVISAHTKGIDQDVCSLKQQQDPLTSIYNPFFVCFLIFFLFSFFLFLFSPFVCACVCACVCVCVCVCVYVCVCVCVYVCVCVCV